MLRCHHHYHLRAFVKLSLVGCLLPGLEVVLTFRLRKILRCYETFHTASDLD